MSDRPVDRRQTWHVNKGIDISYLLTLITIVLPTIMFITDMDARINQNTLRISHVSENQSTLKVDLSNRIDRLDAGLKTIQGQLNMLIQQKSK